jgi:type III restriction enzyme
MRITLKEFQYASVDETVENLREAGREASSRGVGQAVILAAPTGSGKTIIATAAIERLIFGGEGVPPDPKAIVLWVTDQPQLNEQTRRKMLSASSQLGPDRLVVVDDTFDDPTLEPGKIFFLNTQKLGSSGRLVRRSDNRRHTFWEIIDNTIASSELHLYVVIDEAHRGMTENRSERERATSIMQRFVKGDGEMRAAPVILGITATPQRFYDLLTGTKRTIRTQIVDPIDVRESGLIKERVIVFHPTETQPSDITLLREAAKDLTAITGRWASYAERQGEEPVVPLLIVQVEDGDKANVSKTNLDRALSAITSEVGQLPSNAFAHAFQDSSPITVGTREVRYLAPADITHDEEVRVVFFKSSLNTGWDCPRAEVMMSFRKAVDFTNIAQLVGRMVRAPLARRIEDDERLNSVSLYLPHYDEVAINKVITYLTESGEAAGVIDMSTTRPVVLRRAEGSESAFEALEKIPTYVLPRNRKISDIRRLIRLARNLSQDLIDLEADDRERAKIIEMLLSEHERLLLDPPYEALIAERGSLSMRRSEWKVGEELDGAEEFELEVSLENIGDLFALAGRRFGEGLHEGYWKSRCTSAPTLVRQARLEIVALSSRNDVHQKLNIEASKRIRRLFNEHKAAITSLPERRRQKYDEIKGLSAEAELGTLRYPESIEVPAAEARWVKHLYTDEDSRAPFALNGWEQRTVEREIKSGSVWMRNLDRKTWALLVPYEDAGEKKALFPDFLFVRSSGIVDILDPHNPELADAPAKAKGLADFAEKHGGQFGRIEIIAEYGGSSYSLDLKDESIRQKVFRTTTAASLRAIFLE